MSTLIYWSNNLHINKRNIRVRESQKDTKLKIRELVELNKKNVSTQAKKAEELTANLVVYNEAIKMMGDEIFDLGVENKALRNKIG